MMNKTSLYIHRQAIHGHVFSFLLDKKPEWSIWSCDKYMFNLLRVLPGDLAVKNLPANGGDMSSIPGSAIFPGKGNGNPP